MSKQKAILLYLIYNSNIIENTTVTLNTSSVVYENNDHLKILELDIIDLYLSASFDMRRSNYFKRRKLFLKLVTCLVFYSLALYLPKC